MNQPLLRIEGVNKHFGGVAALSDVSLSIQPGEIYGLIGPNGAGKTTFFNVMTGLYSADSGSFQLDGQAYRPTAVHRVARAGIARTFQNIRLFNAMSALENVMVGRHVRTRNGLWAALSRHRRAREEEARTREQACRLLEYVGLAGFADYRADSLSYGHQRRLEIARALATEPLLLALDEPAAGMNASEKVQLRGLLEKIRGDGHSLLLIEHDVKLVMGVCDRISVLDYGRVIAEGVPEQVRRHPAVIQAYLGASADV
ncbi:Branched-chain amino acid transport ATP-binding protein LivG [Pseudomonas chlororaphis subsp. aurantiaca]|uniref:ABC transporter ATP-binding protein n=1 Tax=Pseudomonas chlororaphis TaxID=587753 RepID=UPI000F57A4B1|nr:ABC transporter ATP-binding protein [Pseudomonas chlororaphis]AZD36422.1 Branched-chain amino acid transport ATP-binding protein LivG [Pseudomonas chlororaphis subsp. aurantiaca]AZD42761.1 Branched-chain amino acid transport ATP-binding protein LivG [Pseudomonas chlororaphis subsp. aurantiaca]QQX56400.1 ABC transporter ATP-binding protein [Pseudomonas chlororaphis subsp. aurantiaca]